MVCGLGKGFVGIKGGASARLVGRIDHSQGVPLKSRLLIRPSKTIEDRDGEMQTW
jgi:hypothetical protein